MKKMLRIGVIGASGRGHMADLAHLPEENSFLVAGADIYEDNRKVFLERCRKDLNTTPAVYSDYREMIEKEHLDAVVVTSPDFVHEEHAVFALQHKVAVYLEKPLAISIEGADRILQTAYDNRTLLLVGHNMRYMAFTRRMKELVDSGIIGEVKAIWCRHFISYGGDAYFRDWHSLRKNANSLLLQKGAHDIDIIHWLAGGYSTQVNGIGNLSVYNQVPRRPKGEERLDKTVHESWWSNQHWPPLEQRDMSPEIDVEDLNMIQMRLDNGVLACYLQCHYTPDSCRNYTVIGTKGRLENYGDYSPSSQIQVWTKRKDGFRLEGDVTYREDPFSGAHGGADPKIIRSFVDALHGEYDVWSSPQAARYSVAAGCCGAESIRNGGIPVSVPKLPENLENFDFTRLKEK